MMAMQLAALSAPVKPSKPSRNADLPLVQPVPETVEVAIVEPPELRAIGADTLRNGTC